LFVICSDMHFKIENSLNIYVLIVNPAQNNYIESANKIIKILI